MNGHPRDPDPRRRKKPHSLAGPLAITACAAALLVGSCGPRGPEPAAGPAPASSKTPPAETALLAAIAPPRLGLFNGGGAVGLAARVSQTLEAAGYDVAVVDNYRDPANGSADFGRPHSEIRYYPDLHRRAAEEVAALLGLDAARVTPGELDGRVDVAVVLGRDFDAHRLAVATAAPEAEAAADWSSLPRAVKMGPPPRALDDGVYVSKTNRTVTLFRTGEIVRQYPCATGRDGSTPEGAFTVNVKLVDPVWYWKGKAIPPGPDNGLGSRFIGITNKDHPKGYGLHGTNEPDSIGREASHGCIRLLNADAEDLYEKVKVGDAVVIGP
jgi:hypothetical protein